MRSIKRLLPALALIAFLAIPAAGQAKTIHVKAGQSIQAAVDSARPGDKIQVGPGTYNETSKPCTTEPSNSCAVVVTKDQITIQGKNATLAANGDQDTGIDVGKSSDGSTCIGDPNQTVSGSTIKGMTVQGFEDYGLHLLCVEDFTVSKVSTIDNEEYGIFPSHVTGGRVDHSFASGANDTGVYVGQSQDVRMDHNTATGNVSGYEIENSANVVADHNLATGNTGGILVFTLPFLDVNSGHDNVVRQNTVINNNKANTCGEPGDDVCQVPVGTGILILAADGTIVDSNTVKGNDSFGIAVSNICVGQNIPPAVCAILDIQPDADNTHTIFNTVTGNGLNPDPNLPSVFAVDLAWDGTGTGNCWSNNVFNTEFPPGVSTISC